jgi:hypothetical protein
MVSIGTRLSLGGSRVSKRKQCRPPRVSIGTRLSLGGSRVSKRKQCRRPMVSIGTRLSLGGSRVSKRKQCRRPMVSIGTRLRGMTQEGTGARRNLIVKKRKPRAFFTQPRAPPTPHALLNSLLTMSRFITSSVVFLLVALATAVSAQPAEPCEEGGAYRVVSPLVSPPFDRSPAPLREREASP